MDKSPFIGQMDRKIVLSVKNTVQSATGAETVQEETVCSPFASMQDLIGNEEIDGKIISYISRSYTVRFRKEIIEHGTNLILEDKGKQYEVYDLAEIGRKKHIQLKVRIYE